MAEVAAKRAVISAVMSVDLERDHLDNMGQTRKLYRLGPLCWIMVEKSRMTWA